MAGRRGRGTGWIVGILIILALAWVGYWYAARYAADTAIAKAAARGIGCGDVAVGGFPFQLDVRCDHGAYAANGSTAGIGGFLAHAPLYTPGAINARLESPLTINLPQRNIALTATWTAGSANGGAWTDGVNAASAAFTTLKIENSGNLPLATASADSASGALSPAGGGSYNLATSVHRLSLARQDGGAYPTLDLDLSAIARDVGALGTDPAKAFLAWLRNAPKVDINKLRVAANDAIISASGALSLSKDGLLNGNILLRYNSIDALANLIETLHPGTRDKYAAAFQGITAMSKPVQTEDGPALQTALTFTDGLIWLTVIPLPMQPLPAIKF
ncbi:MAG TPA: DUF2125 domain-containing protein [Bauldia sp.]|nr:DUF2125 domain-containing protein [Bauldia sp.]